ncbi:MAG: cysteine desulfurase [Vicinamibacterales bacterium]
MALETQGSPGVAGHDLDIAGEFPALRQEVYGKRLVYLDNANTTQKPNVVIEATSDFYAHDNANVHRSTHALSERANRAYERAREDTRAFVNAATTREIVFTRGCTDSLNLVAQSFGRSRLGPGDEVLLTWMEHHSNIVPWQIACEQTGAKLVVVPITDAGDLDLAAYERLLSPATKLVSLIHVSNALGTVNPVRALVAQAHARDIPVIVDGAQAVAHMPVDVRALDCDFYAWSAHKMYGPTGVGVLYGKQRWLEAMPPYQGGGDMIASVTFAKTTYNELPFKFEAGTPNIAGVVGLGAAVRFLSGIGLDAVRRHEAPLLAYLVERLAAVPGLTIVGTPAERSGVVSFVMEGVHPHDIGTIVDREGVAIRTGQHCTQPVMDRYGVSATARASLAVYNSKADVDALADALHKVHELFG